MAELRPHYIDVDLKKNTQYNVPVVTQNDTATHFIIRVTDDGLSDPELLDAYQEITMTSQRPDGESFYLTGTRIPGTNEIEFHLGTDETAFSGSVLASLQFYLVEDASRYTSAQFRYDVKKDLTKNYTPTQREETLVEVVLRDGPVAIQEAKDAKIAVDGALVELEQDKTAAIERLDEVTEENKTVFRQPVNTFADLATTYPNPEQGTTVRVTGESATYRYSDGSWVKTDEYNPTAIDQVTAQLAETDAKKADISLVETKVNDIGISQINKNKGLLDQTYFTDEVKQQWAGTAPINAVPAAKSITSEKVAIGAVTPSTTSFLRRGKNHVNNKLFVPGIVSYQSGLINNSANYSVIPDFIDVKPSTTYTQSGPGDIAFFDENKNFISGTGINHVSGVSPRTFVTPPNAHYLLTSVINSLAATYQIEEGDASTSFENYYLKVANLIIEDSSLPMIPGEKITNVPSDKLDIMEASTNLFNPDTVTMGKYLSASSGNLLSNESMITSDFIAIDEAVNYSFKVTRYMVFFDQNKIRISGVSGYNANHTVTSPTGAKYIRFSWSANDIALSSQQMNIGQQLLPYEKFGRNIKKTFIRKVSGDAIEDGSIYPSKLHESAIGLGNTKTFKMLMIGNSYALDPTTYIHQIAKSAGINIFVGILYRDGEPLSAHYENAVNNNKNYYFYRRAHINGTETFDRLADYSIEDGVLYEDWDLITFQQRSWLSHDYTTYQPFLNDLKTYVESKVLNDDVEYGIHQTWVKPLGEEQYEDLIDAYQQAMNDINSGVLIPNGTSVQNARTNSYLTSIDNELTEDGTHLSILGDYIAGLTIFESLLSGRYKKDIFADVKFKPSEVSTFHAYLGRLAAKNAVLNPFKITEI